MLALKPAYIVDERQRRKSVLLPVSQWKQVVAALEELDEIREYDQAKRGAAESVPFEQAVREIREGYRG